MNIDRVSAQGVGQHIRKIVSDLSDIKKVKSTFPRDGDGFCRTQPLINDGTKISSKPCGGQSMMFE